MARSMGNRMRRHAGSAGRFLAFLALWCILMGLDPKDLVVGLFASACGTLAAAALLPGSARWPSVRGLMRFAAAFLRQSLLAGIDVAKRAFSPRLPLAPGFVAFRPSLPAGLYRDAFVSLSAMMPGTLPVGSDGRDGVVVHCLDEHQPVLPEMAKDEARLRAVFSGERRHG